MLQLSWDQPPSFCYICVSYKVICLDWINLDAMYYVGYEDDLCVAPALRKLVTILPYVFAGV